MTDVCLILEGTYPFVSGGVSTWVHQLVTSMKDLRFSIVYVSPFPNAGRQYKYDVPANVLDIQDLYLHDYAIEGSFSSARRRREVFPRLAKIHDSLLQGRMDCLEELLPLFRDPAQRISPRDVFSSQESWDILVDFYERYGGGVSFVDFFWTWRAIYLPLVKIITAPIPPARLYHTVCTGYAGLLAAIARITQDRSMILTEHGVYTHERMLEISQADWIFTPAEARFRIRRELPYFKRLWIGLFNLLGAAAYRHADRIVTLYEGNRTKEILAGADPKKISIIPNGLDLKSYRDLRHVPRPARGGAAATVAFIGRVVAIKDVKTYLLAAKIVLSRLENVAFLILGPTDEDPSYTAECRQLADTLELTEKVRFLGKVDVNEYYPKIDVVVLTSLSEAQPYVILEANASGVPVVATDVGACREMLEGRSLEDRRLGPSGILTGVANPEQTAEAIMKLLSDWRQWKAFSEAGRTRVSRFYDQDDLVSQYLNLYEQGMR
jgi:glycosyltransferase involved in cell wall biosynthesis